MRDKATDLLPMVRKYANLLCNIIPQSLPNSCGGAEESALGMSQVTLWTHWQIEGGKGGANAPPF